MADPVESEPSFMKDVWDGVSGFAGSIISGAGDVIDIETGGKLGGRILGPVGEGIEIYDKASDEDGFTAKDGVSVGFGVIAGAIAKGVIQGAKGGPYGAAIGGIAAGLAVGFGIDNFPGTDPDLAKVTDTDFDPKTGLITKRIFQPLGFEFVNGVKVDILHVTEVVTDTTGKIVSRTTYKLEVPDAGEALGLIRDYVETKQNQSSKSSDEARRDAMGWDGGSPQTSDDARRQAMGWDQGGGSSSSGSGGKPAQTSDEARRQAMGWDGGSKRSGGSDADDRREGTDRGGQPAKSSDEARRQAMGWDDESAKDREADRSGGSGRQTGPDNARREVSGGGSGKSATGPDDVRRDLSSGKPPERTDKNGRKESDPRFTGPQPILLDLDGNGVKITEFGNSLQFMTGKDGLMHRTSWAGTGDGVLFYDAGNDNQITEARQTAGIG